MDVQELINDNSVSKKQIEGMFEGMPKEPMGIPSSDFGISEDTFVAFNGMLDVVLDASGGSESGDNSPGVTPSLCLRACSSYAHTVRIETRRPQ